MSNESCRLCRYQKAKPWEAPYKGYYCFCEDSPLFGSVVSRTGKDSPGCDCYMQSTYNDMDFLEALKILTFTPRTQEQMSEVHPYPMILHRDNLEDSPHITLVFKDNTQLEEWRDAQVRVFSEVMDMMQKNGEFTDEDEEAGNADV